MCGICFIIKNVHISSHSFQFNPLQHYITPSHPYQLKSQPFNQYIQQNQLYPKIQFQHLKQLIRNRGPDYQYSTQKENQLGYQSVLHLRGKQQQRKYVNFLYNGQIYCVYEQFLPVNTSDTQFFYTELQKSKSTQQILQFLKSLEADFSFIYTTSNKVYIGKDYFGKRSLLMGLGQNQVYLTSCASGRYKENKMIQQEYKFTELQQKYLQQYKTSVNKTFYQIPNNTLYELTIEKQKITWNSHTIITKPFAFLLQPNNKENLIIKAINVLQRAVLKVVRNIEQYSTKQVKQQTSNSKIAILFSGGIDCTLLARIIDMVLPDKYELDLVNVVYAKDAPDRITAIQSYQQLKNLSKRKFNLILITQQIPKDSPQHLDLIYPKITHMDYNISLIIAKASTLKGTLYQENLQIKSGAKVVISGLGADEIFLGYSRYRVSFLRGGYKQLAQQAKFDLQRLWIRNLGRDDRAAANNGIEMRYPYLDRQVMNFVSEISIDKLANFNLPRGKGDKLFLREMGREVGLKEVCNLSKRAIQFGTRLSNLMNKSRLGSNRKGNGRNIFCIKQDE